MRPSAFHLRHWPRSAYFLIVLVLSRTSLALAGSLRLSTSPSSRGDAACPARCEASGPQSGNWSLYHDLEQTALCQHSIFYEFSLFDDVDVASKSHRIYACTSYGPDWGTLPSNTTALKLQSAPKSINTTYQIGWWPDAQGSSVASPLNTLIGQMRLYLMQGFGRSSGPVIIHTGFGSTFVGLYVGEGIQSSGIGENILQYLENSITPSNTAFAASVAVQFCQPNQNADHVFGLMATGNGTFYAIQNALKSWSRAECLDLPQVRNVTGPLSLLTPLYHPSNLTHSQNKTEKTAQSASSASVTPRGTCSTTQVVSGDSCGSLAQKCGITPTQFTQYNPASNECSTLQPGEHVCCSAGTLPDFAPKPNADGSCATYTVQSGDSCSTIAAANSITVAEINTYNAHTWAWSGCTDIWVGTIICLSSGTPPMPAPLSNAVCGPQKPGTAAPSSGTDISTLNPCPLNACCDVWGQCGTTADFCTNSSTGAPGTAQPGTNGCISNCGTQLVRSSPPSTYRSIGYWEGYNLERPCLYQAYSQIEFSNYTHLYFAFGTLSSSFEVQIPGNTDTQFMFQQFLEPNGPLRILSIGGWAFSTDPSTYMIFREGVTAANRLSMAHNIANFVNSNNLDGVNIDWEYPGAPDIPGIPPASPDDGDNYLAFLAILRNLLPDKEVTIAAPASYWYLKGFPIEAMSKLVDYIIFMTYDLHGQWDANNQWSQLGCPTGNCLRSDVNLTETIGALVMITKAGVPSNQVVVGVTSYGRSFAMAEAGCYGPMCKFLGSAGDSQAATGPCTQTAGYIANAEILAILSNSSRVNQNFVDPESNSNILVYDNTQWVGWMSEETKATRTALYKNLAMGGTTDWATDLQQYNDAPFPTKSWITFLNDIANNLDPYVEGNRTGNWTTLTCSDSAIQDEINLSPQVRWAELDASNAWSDAVNIWFNIDKPNPHGTSFLGSIHNTFHSSELDGCDAIAGGGCTDTATCANFQGFGNDGASGPAAYEIYNSFVIIKRMYALLYDSIESISATYIGFQAGKFEDTFAPLPLPSSNDLLEEILLNLLGLGLSVVAGGFFSESVPAAADEASSSSDGGDDDGDNHDLAKDITFAAISFGAAIGTAVIASKEEPTTWSPADQDSFTAYMGQVLTGWQYTLDDHLWSLFDGSPFSVQTLGKLISNGNLIAGACNGCSHNDTNLFPPVPGPQDPQNSTISQAVEGYINLAFFGFSIPAAWTASGQGAFVLDSGYPCSAQNPMSSYMSASIQEATYSCFNNKLYYLVIPDLVMVECEAKVDFHEDCNGCNGGSSCVKSVFAIPPGLSALTGSPADWGGITRDILVQGSVNTYSYNNNANGGPAANPADPATLSALLGQNITTPGFIRLPVCSADVAYASVTNPSQSNATAAGYPCNPLQGITDCSGYTYQAATSSASPLVSDCMHLVANIQGTFGEWTTGISGQRDIASYGTCNFGVQNDGVTGDVTFKTGSQDIVTIITQSIQKYQSNGRVGAGGYMQCSGDAGSQKVQWGLY